MAIERAIESRRGEIDHLSLTKALLDREGLADLMGLRGRLRTRRSEVTRCYEAVIAATDVLTELEQGSGTVLEE